MPFFPLIKMPSSASRYSWTCANHSVICLHNTSTVFKSGCMTLSIHKAKTAYSLVCLLELPALDPQWRVHPGWDKSRTQATHIRYSQTAWAPQDRSAAERGPSETEAPIIAAQNIKKKKEKSNHLDKRQDIWPLSGTYIHPWWSGSSHIDPNIKERIVHILACMTGWERWNLNCFVIQKEPTVSVKHRLYLQFAYNFCFCDGHQVCIFNSKSREGNDR